MAREKDEEFVTFEFHIRDLGGVAQMQSIPPSILPNFHGLENEDPDEFLFQFEVLCRGYGIQKLKIFSLTLKGAALRWFMSLGGNCIQTWKDMKHVFLKRYQDYCRVNEDMFEITQGEEETLENYVECFQYNLQRSKLRQSGKDTLNRLLLKGIKNEYLEILSLMGTGDVFQLPYDDVYELCRRYSRGKFNTGKNIPSSQFLKSAAGIGITKVEIGNLFEIFKTDIISSLNSPMDILQVGKNKEFEEAFCHQCQKKYLTKDCPLDSLRICALCSLKHSTDCCPSLPRMKATYQRDLGVATNLLQQSWQPWPTCMVQSSIPPFLYSHNQLVNTPTPWNLLQPQLNPYQPCSQNLHGPSYDHMDTTLPGPLYSPQASQQYPIYLARSAIQANQLHLPQPPSHKTPLCPMHIPIQSTPHPNYNKAL